MHHGIQRLYYRHLKNQNRCLSYFIFNKTNFGFIHSLINIKFGTNYKLIAESALLKKLENSGKAKMNKFLAAVK